MRSRILILFSCFLVLWGVLIVRAGFLQMLPDARLDNLKRRQFETSLQIRTRRGAIVDRQGNELAASVPAFSLFADPKLIQDSYGLAKKLAKTFNLPEKLTRKRLRDRQRRFIWLKRQVSEAERDLVKKWDEPGLGFIEEPKRVYPNGNLLNQVLGFVGSEGGGLEGLELQFNKDLEGQLKQVLLPRDARGRPLLADGRSVTEAPDGADLELTVDYEAQFNLEQELRSVLEKFEASSAMGIIMDAQSSEILAMANMPLGNARNRVVTDAFEPGSIMKTFVIASALRENLVRPSTRYYCERGRWKVGDKWIKEAMESEKFEWMNVTEILARSSNIGTAKIAFDLGDRRLFQGLTDFGFGAKTGIDLPGEARGIVNPLPWRPHLLSNIAFGQGIAVTPLQMMAAYGAIANGGILKKPILVKKIKRPGEDVPEVFQAQEIRRVLTPPEAATMRLMLTAATEEGANGWNARIPGYHVAGKTGTAQKVDTVKGGYMPNSYVSSFAGLVPAHNPRYVILVVVDDPKKAYYGSQVAAPVFSRLAQYMVRRAGLPPVLITENNMVRGQVLADHKRAEAQMKAIADLKATVETEASTTVFPNLIGMTLREALSRVRPQARQVDVRGHGVVVRTVPSSGASVNGRHRVMLVLENPD